MPANPFTASRITALTERVRAVTRQQIIDLTLAGTERNLEAIGASFGETPPFTRFVDGSEHKPLSEVNDHGFTLTRFELLGNVVDETIKALILASPVGPEKGGHYRDDHWLFVNGTRRDFSTEGAMIEVGQNDTIVVVNLRPYARKIEGGGRFARGNAGGRLLRGSGTEGHARQRRPGLSVQAPDGVYEITGRALQRRFGNIATITFVYRSLIGGAAASPGGRASTRYPALEITAKA